MNEQKRSRDNYFYPKQTKQEQCAEELLVMIKTFVSHNQLKPADLILLTKMIKQLNAEKNKTPIKILRSMSNKFEKIKQSYYQR